jgi:hypothetical protein
MPQALKCPACNGPLEIPEGRSQFYCHYCGTPVVVPQENADGFREGDLDESLGKAVVIPDKLKVEDWGDELLLSWSWYSHAVWFLLPFCIGWNAFLIGWYSIAMTVGNEVPFGFRLIMFLFPMAHVAVGLGLAYACASMLLNRTYVKVQSGQLEVSHAPIPFPKRQSVAVEEIEQLYVKHIRSALKKGGSAHAYPLCVKLKSGRELQLLPTNNEVDLARAIEQLVEERLGIRDASVPGEHRD